MAMYKAYSPKRNVITTSQLVRRFALANLALYLFAGLVWFAVRYYNSSTSGWSGNTWNSAPRVEYKDATPSRHIVLPTSLSYIAEASAGDASHAPINKSDFSSAYARFDRALSVQKQIRPEVLVQTVNSRVSSGGAACDVTWNDGEPVLHVGGAGTARVSLAGALNRCAQAVENLPR